MYKLKTFIRELHSFLVLWSTQSLSSLGSSMTGFALIIWSYQQQGSALSTALLSVCSYTPYILMAIFAGALSDSWNKKITILASDTFAALCTAASLLLLCTGRLEIWHLYLLNALNGLMSTVQRPAADVAVSLLIPKKYYQRTSGMQQLSNSLINIITPAAASAVLALAGIEEVLLFDLLTFAVAFIALLCFVKIPEPPAREEKRETVMQSVRSGLGYLKQNRGILDLILFLAVINLIASIYEAALPAMLLSREGGGEAALGIVNTAMGIAMLAGSVLASFLPAPKSRVRVICNSLLFAMSTENFLLALGRSVPVWCIGAALGWIFIPMMNANMDVLLRNRIPIEMQGRVFSVRNSLQFFTIPIGYFVGGLLVDRVFEPLMASLPQGTFLTALFGSGKGSGAALLLFVIGFAGMFTCLFFRRDKNLWKLEE